MPGDEISRPIHVIFNGDNFALSQRPQVVALCPW